MKKAIALLGSFGLLLLLGNPAQAECWDQREQAQIQGFAELDGEIILSFKDAVECTPVREAQVVLEGERYAADWKGYVRLPLERFEAMEDEFLKLRVEKRGYIPLETEVRVEVGVVLDRQFVLSKEIPLHQVRFVLQWSERPRDLDLHLVGEGFHISYRHMRSAANQAMLDRDDLDGHGPETITLTNPGRTARYEVFVHNYSGERPISREATVSVYANNRLDRMMRLPSTRKRAVKILEIVNRTLREANLPVEQVP